MIRTKSLYDFDDLLIEPVPQSGINSRSEIKPYDEIDFLPLMTAPMDTVVGKENYLKFYEKRIHTVLPRTSDAYSGYVSYEAGKWRSYSLDQFEQIFLKDGIKNISHQHPMYALIDVANGHMIRVTNLIDCAKQKYGRMLQIMAGNIANPRALIEMHNVGVDYVRIGIGNGGGCLTTQQTGIGYPMASLISDSIQVKIEYQLTPKIIADGGMQKYADIIKALALGADYVMVGNMFNKALESASENVIHVGNAYYKTYEQYVKDTTYVKDDVLMDSIMAAALFKKPKSLEELMHDGVLYKKFRGMSTKEVQQEWGNNKIKTSEGIVRYQQVEYTLATWTQNFIDYLRSAMSYCDARTLKEFIGKPTLNVITENAHKRFNK
jgi:IMP dehydrogenase/GMP reductase